MSYRRSVDENEASNYMRLILKPYTPSRGQGNAITPKMAIPLAAGTDFASHTSDVTGPFVAFKHCHHVLNLMETPVAKIPDTCPYCTHWADG